MTKFIPYAEDAASMAIGELTIENGTDKVALYGSLDLTRDKAGLAKARDLQAFLADVVQALEATPALPDAVPLPRKSHTVKNPFG